MKSALEVLLGSIIVAMIIAGVLYIFIPYSWTPGPTDIGYLNNMMLIWLVMVMLVFLSIFHAVIFFSLQQLMMGKLASNMLSELAQQKDIVRH